MSKMIVLYGKASDKMPVFTVEFGFIPRIEWLMDEEKRFKKRGIKVELKHEAGESWLLVEKLAGVK